MLPKLLIFIMSHRLDSAYRWYTLRSDRHYKQSDLYLYPPRKPIFPTKGLLRLKASKFGSFSFFQFKHRSTCIYFTSILHRFGSFILRIIIFCDNVQFVFVRKYMSVQFGSALATFTNLFRFSILLPGKYTSTGAECLFASESP